MTELDGAPWLPLDALDLAMQSLVESSGDPGYGLVAADSIAWVRLGVIPMLSLCAPTLRHILDDIRRYLPLLIERTEVKLVEHGEFAEFSFGRLEMSETSWRFRAETSLLSLLKTLRCMGAGEVALAEFDYAQPAYGDRYQAAFGTEVAFDRHQCALHFKAAVLDTPATGRDASMYLTLKSRAEAELAMARGPLDLGKRLRELALARLPQRLSMSDAASLLAVSERSLRRQLATSGVSYSTLMRESQQALAEQLLLRGDYSVKQIAEAVGFSSPSCFHRAFRRWLGATPRQWMVSGSPVAS